MMKYYIYSIKTDKKDARQYAAVHDPELFAAYHYDPKIMTYTGVSVEASDPMQAIRIFTSPTTGEVFLENEPLEAAKVRERYESDDAISSFIRDAESKLQIEKHSKEIAAHLNSINESMQAIVNILVSKSDLSHTYRESLYRMLKKYIVANFNTLYSYKPPTDGKSE